MTKTLLAGNYYVYASKNWDNWVGKAYPFVISKIDPMILILQGTSFDWKEQISIKIAQSNADLDQIKEGSGSGDGNPYTDRKVDFVARVLAFAPASEPGVASTVDMEFKMGEWMNTALAVSNKKWKLSSTVKISKITIDARNNKIRFD